MIKRNSPVRFDSLPARAVIRDGWEVVIAYEDEGTGPFLIDLSHLPKWDIQSADLSQIQPAGAVIPEFAGACVLEKDLLINRLNRTQAMVWHISGEKPQIPDEPGYTDITESHTMLGLLGKEIFSIMEKITALDLQPPGNQPPFLLQGPVLQVPCHLVALEKDALIIAFSRGYAHCMVEAILEAGSAWGIRPAGEQAFKRYLEGLSR